MFHYQNGLFFKRNENGSVHIEQRLQAKDNVPLIYAVDIDKDGWCSIIASMSHKGETTETWEEAQLFHTGKPFTNLT